LPRSPMDVTFDDQNNRVRSFFIYDKNAVVGISLL
jgi:hypothetical protein